MKTEVGGVFLLKKLPVIGLVFSLLCLQLSSAEPGVPGVETFLPTAQQTVVVNTFEAVEMEKLHIRKEVGKLSKDDADFLEAVPKC